MATALGAGAWRSGISKGGDRLNPNAHPTVEEDSAAEAKTREDLRWLVSTFFAPDTLRLARTFVRTIPKGLILGGCACGNNCSEDDVLHHLKENW